jgi:hypothetical protein
LSQRESFVKDMDSDEDILKVRNKKKVVEEENREPI